MEWIKNQLFSYVGSFFPTIFIFHPKLEVISNRKDTKNSFPPFYDEEKFLCILKSKFYKISFCFTFNFYISPSSSFITLFICAFLFSYYALSVYVKGIQMLLFKGLAIFSMCPPDALSTVRTKDTRFFNNPPTHSTGIFASFPETLFIRFSVLGWSFVNLCRTRERE